MDNTPFEKQPQLVDLEEKYDLVTTIWGGTSAMRDAGTEFLPKEPEEKQENYSRRLNRTVLYPAYKDAIIASAGKILDNGIEVVNGSPMLVERLQTIDEDKDTVDTFIQKATVSSLHYGCSYILVDYPVINENSTLADERQQGAQPYWVLVEAIQVLEASPIFVNGQKELGIFRYQERIAYKSGEFTTSFVDQVKEFRILEDGQVRYRTFRKVEEEIVLHDSGILFGLSSIPVVPVYANKVGFFVGSPTFIDLAYENILNWQINSDYQNIVHHSQVPMLTVTGGSDSYDENGVKNNVVISPNTVLEFSNPDGSAEWVEVSGSASEVGRQAIQDSYDRMSNLALEALKDDTSDTATEAKLGAQESVSTLSVAARQVREAVEQAIDFTYNYMLIENPGTTVVLEVSSVNEQLNESATQNQTSSGDGINNG